MGAYSGVGAYLSKWVLGEGAYSGGGVIREGGGVIREWGLIRSFTVEVMKKRNKFVNSYVPKIFYP